MFKLTAGSCPKSYGPTVARAAGIPASIAERAIVISDAFEAGHHAAVTGTAIAKGAPCSAGASEGVAVHKTQADTEVSVSALGHFKGIWHQVQNASVASLRELVQSQAC